MNNIQDRLLDSNIKSKINLRNIDIDLELISKDCESRWPGCRVSIDDYEIFNGKVVNSQEIVTSYNSQKDTANINIEYYGKTNFDTKTNEQGTIISNQILSINQFKLNGVDIIKNGLIYKAIFQMNLDPAKQEYFSKHNIETVHHDYHFYENGIWSLQIQIPVLTYIINTTKHLETFERTPYNDIMMTIMDKLDI